MIKSDVIFHCVETMYFQGSRIYREKGIERKEKEKGVRRETEKKIKGARGTKRKRGKERKKDRRC